MTPEAPLRRARPAPLLGGVHARDVDEEAPDARPPASGTWIEIDARCLEANIQELRRFLGEESRLCMVVKGNAYGHGYDPVVPLAEAAGVRDFAVFSAREAAGFYAASDGRSRLQVMGHSCPENLGWLLDQGAEVWLNDPADWPRMVEELEDSDNDARVHLEIETGMNRGGMPVAEARRVALEVDRHPRCTLAGVCTHLAGAEDTRNIERLQAQKNRFRAFLDGLSREGVEPELRHVSSSAAALTDPECRMDLVRMGIAMYGLWPSREVHQRVEAMPDPPELRNVLSWKSRVVALKDVPDGEFVGYGSTYMAEGDIRIAVVAVGYADGFARGLSNVGYVLVRGMRASIIGNVNMNMLQVHVTHIPDIQVGDPVVIVGRQGDQQISVASFSDFNNALNYEVMARLSREIPRFVIRPKKLHDPLV